MAGSLNKALLIGNLTKDAELRYAASGAAIANITVATNRQFVIGGCGYIPEGYQVA